MFLHKIPVGKRIKAILRAKYKKAYIPSGPIFQTDDTFGETRLVREQSLVEGVVYERPNRNNSGIEHPTKKIKCILTDNGKSYRLDELREIEIV